MNPKVTVLINNYNYARFLRCAIDSVLAQTYSPVELVVVDDGSTDESREILRSYGDKILPVLKENGGQASAFNAGFAHSTGDIICFLDSDDYLSPIAVERIVAHWKADTDILHHRLRVVNGAGEPIGYHPEEQYPLESGDVTPFIMSRAGYTCPSASGMAYSRRILQKLLPMPTLPWRICADAYLFLSAPFLARVDVMEEPVAFYRIHGGNNLGLTIDTRQKLDRAYLRKNIWNSTIRSLLLKKLAKQHGLRAPINQVYFSKLLLYRAASPAFKVRRGAALYRKMVRDMLADQREKVPWKIVLRRTVVGLLILFAPRWVLRRIYPGIFTENR